MSVKAKTTVATVANIKPPSLLTRIADRYHVDADKMATTLKATVFRGATNSELTNEQLMMLLVVADQYKLNPFTAEIFAFPSQRGIVPIVSVDGWIRIINERPELAGLAFKYDDDGDWVECSIERKDRTQPVTVREYMTECKRDTKPWQSHPQRMLRHKALIQCARVAFGFAGIYDQDEGERIVEGQIFDMPVGKPATAAPESVGASAPTYTSVPLDDLRRELDQSGVPENEFFAHFEIGGWDELALSQVNDAFEFIRRATRG